LHKNKRKKIAQEKIQWKREIFLSLGIIAVGITAATFASEWVKALPIMQPHYAKPGELSLSNGIWILVVYCIFLVAMIVGGYLVQKRIEE
jgi:polyferredoxin